MRVDPRLRPFLRILVLGVACSLLVGLGGWLVERQRLGPDRESAYARVEQEVKSEFDRMALTLTAMAQEEAKAAAPILLQAADDRDLRPLFATSAALVARDPSQQLAITTYDTSGAPLAWAGRPSELSV